MGVLIQALLCLAIFCAGYWTGWTNATTVSDSRVAVNVSGEERRPSRESRPSGDGGRAGNRPRARPAEEYARLMGLVADGTLRVSGVDIRGDTLIPSDEVKDFFGLTQEEFGEMKEMGRRRLQARQEHEAEMAVIRSASDEGIEFELPADPTFGETQAAEYVEALSRRFGPHVAGVLGESAKSAYGDLSYARIVKYTLSMNESNREMLLRTDLPETIRDSMEGTRNYEIKQQNIDESGNSAPGITGSNGSMNLNDTGADAHRPRYHFLWERRDRLRVDEK